MQIEQTLYGDYTVTDELCFDLNSINTAAYDIFLYSGESVLDWPMSLEYFNGYHVLTFSYVNKETNGKA